MVTFAETLEQVTIDTVEGGKMTKDLALLVRPDHRWLTTEEFTDAFRRRPHGQARLRGLYRALRGVPAVSLIASAAAPASGL